MFELTNLPIDGEQVLDRFSSPSIGGVVTFAGCVRDHNLGRRVKSLEYEVYPELALKEGQRVVDEAKKKFPLIDAYAIHRYGHLQLKDAAVFVAVFSSHRDAAFDACRYIIDEIKLRVPIWKREHYADGELAWIDCAGCASKARTHRHDHHHKQNVSW
jgi:molybdopterin synthase catalytic subunit